MRQAAQAFEAQVMAQMLRPAFEAASDAKSPFGGGAAEAQWRPMLLDAFAAAAARSCRALGLQEMFLRQMLRTQEAALNPSSTSHMQDPTP
jgi:flagellar protein FlgJ